MELTKKPDYWSYFAIVLCMVGSIYDDQVKLYTAAISTLILARLIFIDGYNWYKGSNFKLQKEREIIADIYEEMISPKTKYVFEAFKHKIMNLKIEHAKFEHQELEDFNPIFSNRKIADVPNILEVIQKRIITLRTKS